MKTFNFPTAKQLLPVLVLLFTILMPRLAFADVVIDGLKYVITNDSVSVSADDFEITTANIRPTVTENGRTYTVNKIADHGFYRRNQLISITIPNTIIWIGKNAIADCGQLSSITIPSSVVDIHETAFWGNNFNSMVVERGNPRYDSRNYSNAIIETATNKLIAGCKNTSIPNTVTTIGAWAFRGCENMTSIVIPNSVTHVGNSAFNGCPLTSIVLSNSLTSMDEWAFSDCDYTSIVIPNSVAAISNYAFMYCDKLESIVIPNSVRSIGSAAFAWCSQLKSIYIPSSVTYLDDAVFNYINSGAHIYVDHKYPTSITTNETFGWVPSGWTLHVPEGQEEAYRNHEVWGAFGTIIGDIVHDNIPGDVDGNGTVDVGDVNSLVNIVLTQ